MDRRRFLRYGAGIAGVGLVSVGLAGLTSQGFFAQSSTTAASSSASNSASPSTTQYSLLPDYQEFLSWLHSVSGPYSGKSLNISFEAEFGPFATQLIDSDFGNATGISDRYNILPYALQLQDISLMNSAKSDAYDAYSLDVQNLGVFTNLPISPYELASKYPELTFPGLDFADFNGYAWDRIATYPPDLSGGPGGGSASNVKVLPFDTPTLVLFYRKDVYEKLGLTPPATWDEHFTNCQAIQESGLTPFASASMANLDVSIIYEYLAHLVSFGGSLFAVDGVTITPTVDTDVALAALEDFVRFKPLSDPASATYSWEQVFQSVAYETAAHALMFDGFATWINDPQRSVVPGLVGYAQNPAGPKGRIHPYAGSGVGVSRYSKNPEAAWLWVQWATAKGTQEAKVLGQYHNYPTRTSVTQAPEVSSVLQTTPFVVAELMNQVWQSNSLTTLLGFPRWLQASTILGSALNTAWTGSVSPKDALAGAQADLEAMGTLTF